MRLRNDSDAPEHFKIQHNSRQVANMQTRECKKWSTARFMPAGSQLSANPEVCRKLRKNMGHPYWKIYLDLPPPGALKWSKAIGPPLRKMSPKASAARASGK